MDKKTRRKRRRELNKKNFPSEAWFEKLLKSRAIKGYHRNLCLINLYFGDFVFCKKKLVIEIDGKSHDGKEAYDQRRDERIKKFSGYDVIRIPHGDTEKAMNAIEIICAQKERRPKVKSKKKIRSQEKVAFEKPRKLYISKAFFKEASDRGLAKKWLENRKSMSC